MLTPDMIQQMNAATGNNVPLDPNAPPSRAQQVLAIAKQAQASKDAAASAATPKLGEGAAGDFAGNLIRSVAAPLVSTGGLLEKGLDQTIGRVGNAIAGNGFTPTHTGDAADQTAESINAGASDSLAGNAGSMVGTIAPYFTGAGEEETAVQVASMLPKLAEHLGMSAESLLPKIAGFLAKNAPTMARDAAIGTAQTGDPVQGAEIGLGSVVGKRILGKGAEAVSSSPEKTTAAITDMVSPKLTAKETAEALANRGGTKDGPLGAIKLNEDPEGKRLADAIQEHVPGFSPKKTLVENINATREAVGKLASDLKDRVVASGQDRIYSFKELGSALKAVPKPTLLVGDLEKVYGNVVSKAMEIARSNGGKVSDLFQARKEFDDFVSREFPNLYSSDTLTPMRSAIKGIRNAMTDFTAEHLPEDVGLRDSLTSQSRLLDAIENMSSKAASGADKEIGTNIIDRATSALKNHPVIGGFGGVAAYEAAKKIPVIGDVLP